MASGSGNDPAPGVVAGLPENEPARSGVAAAALGRLRRAPVGPCAALGGLVMVKDGRALLMKPDEGPQTGQRPCCLAGFRKFNPAYSLFILPRF